MLLVHHTYWEFLFLSSHLWARKRPTMTIRPQDKTPKITKYDIVRQTALWNYHYKWYVFFHFSAPQHSWCTQCTQTSRVAGVCHLCVTDKLTVARHHAAVSDRHFSLSLPFFCRKANVELARCGFSLRQRTRAFSPFSVVVENKVSILNMVRGSYTWRANVVKLIRSGLRHACCKLLRTPTWLDASLGCIAICMAPGARTIWCSEFE